LAPAINEAFEQFSRAVFAEGTLPGKPGSLRGQVLGQGAAAPARLRPAGFGHGTALLAQQVHPAHRITTGDLIEHDAPPASSTAHAEWAALVSTSYPDISARE
jgi:hypothetical protein